MLLGLERFLAEPRRYCLTGKVGLITHAPAVDQGLEQTLHLFRAHPHIHLHRVFGPEHGVRATAQDMIGVDSQNSSDVEIVSLYGSNFDSLLPRDEHLEDLDVLVCDMQDIGCRFYTYTATMALCMQAAKRHGLKFIVLDRPNPIGSSVEGGGIDAGLENFCGLFPIPQRHGMTIGELACLYNKGFGIGCDLEVVTMQGWHPSEYFDSTGLPWVMPSPNMPTLETAIVYPGMCLVEGTLLSEGRGTTRPFELVGAPFVDGRRLARELERLELPGVQFRPCAFQPGFQKHAQTICGGVQLHIRDRRAFFPYRTGLAVLATIYRLWPDDFRWRTEPYEFRDDVPAIDLLTGSASVRESIEGCKPFDEILHVALGGADVYWEKRPAAILYDR